jgi:hypothetical protein
MLTENFYTMIAAVLKGERNVPGDLYIAVGEGKPDWDTIPPDVGRDAEALTNELTRKLVSARDITYLSEDGSTSRDPTPHIRLVVDFGLAEAIGSLRECGVYGIDASEAPGSGTLLSYYIHPLVSKTGTMTLRRAIQIDLTPRGVAEGSRVTRYAANVRTEELHDMENLTGNCQIEEIRPDHRYYFATLEQATAAGYDLCAYCFGRSRSLR